MNTKPGQPGQGGATQVAAVNLAVQSQPSLSPVDDRVALGTLTSLLASPYGWLPSGLGGGG